MQEIISTLTIENQSKITLSGIESVISLSDTQIVLSAQNGKIKLSGSGLKIVGFTSGNGNFAAVGRITEVKFSSKDKFVGLLK